MNGSVTWFYRARVILWLFWLTVIWTVHGTFTSPGIEKGYFIWPDACLFPHKIQVNHQSLLCVCLFVWFFFLPIPVFSETLKLLVRDAAPSSLFFSSFSKGIKHSQKSLWGQNEVYHVQIKCCSNGVNLLLFYLLILFLVFNNQVTFSTCYQMVKICSPLFCSISRRDLSPENNVLWATYPKLSFDSQEIHISAVSPR